MSPSFRLDTTSGVPFYRQIADQVKAALVRGDLRPGQQLPTVRQLAVELSINPNTVVRAYRELERDGVIVTQQGTGTFVAPEPPRVDPDQRRHRLDELVAEWVARARSLGFTLDELIAALRAHEETSR